ncbi:MAG TPA: TraM recognition domain-containing protein [Candidatus Paceibacterota bacterium]
MEKVELALPNQKFTSPEEEIAFLREQVIRREKELFHFKQNTPEVAASDIINAYKITPAQSVLSEEYKMPRSEEKTIVLDLTPETHDQKMSELLEVMQNKGIKNTLVIVESLKNPHIEDDFERFLVQYIKGGYPLKGFKEREPVFRALRVTLYEISLPNARPEKEKALKELLSAMEQFYAGMLSVAESPGSQPAYFSLELAVANHSEEFIFYAAVPDGKRDLFEKHILSLYPDAKIAVKKDDYNIFNEQGISAGSIAELTENPIFPIKTYDLFDHDPLQVVLNSFSKIDKEGEGAAIQIIFNPMGDYYVKRYNEALMSIKKGKKVKEAINIPESFLEHLGELARTIASTSVSKKNEKEKQEPVDERALKLIETKLSSAVVLANVRIVVSSKTEEDAAQIISDIESAFNQFENTNSNKIRFRRVKRGELASLLHYFTFRLFSRNTALPLSLRELSTVLHFPSSVTHAQPQLKIAKAKTAAAPVDLPREGILMGINNDRNVETKIFMNQEDRMRHFYAVGQTGTGKTSLLKNMILQDIDRGDGVCMIDPHGTDIQDVLAHIPPSRYDDVIYFDPSYTARPMALNMLEYDTRYPEQKTFVVNEMLSIFDKLFDMKVAGGPMFEQYFRNSVLLTIEDPESGSTLVDVSRVLANKSFRELKLSRCKNPIVVQFWKEVAEKAGGEASLANIVPYITSKFDNFLSNDIMRPIIAQERSSFNFREVMDTRKILLVNLSKGRLGDLNSHLIGLILVGKILMAALSRVDSLSGDPAPFYLYIDEFQNITTTSIATILSEARKYRLSLHMAHQFIAQLDEKIKDAVFGNVGSMACFRVGAEDAEFLAKQFEPVFTAQDLINLDNHNAYVKLLVKGKTVQPFSLETIRPPQGNNDVADKLKELSYLKFGRPRAEVEAEVMQKYQKKSASI